MLPFERQGRQSGICLRDTPFVSPNDGQCPDIRAPTRVSPRYGPTSRACLKRLGSSTEDRKASAVIGPGPTSYCPSGYIIER
jgi:hypothetical protein